MDKTPSCMQSEQTSGDTVLCGQEAQPTPLRDELTGALIGLVRATDGTGTPTAETYRVILESLYATAPDSGFDDEAIWHQIEIVRREKERLVPDCSRCAAPCGRNDEYDMDKLWRAEKDVRSMKARILFAIRTMAARTYHAMLQGYGDTESCEFFREALFMLGYEETVDGLLPVAQKAGELYRRRTALHDEANTEDHI